MATIAQYTATEAPTDGNGPFNAPPLYFELDTNPDPVRVSPTTGDPERADFVLVGSRRSSTAIDCRKITITIPTGTNSPDLTPDLNGIAADISIKDWTPTTNPQAKTITFTPTADHAVIGRDEGITVQLMGIRINTQVGSAPLRIDVEWRASDTDDPWNSDPTVIDVGKFPPDFYLRNFITEELIIDNGDSVKLNWEAGGASSLKLLYDVAEINVLGKQTYTVHNVRNSTVFYLRATVQVGNNTVERILSTTVTVRRPDLEVRNLVVTGDVTATSGTVRIKDLRGPYGVSLKINSNTVFPTGNNVTVTDNLTTGSLTATSGIVRIKDLRGPLQQPLKINSHTQFLTGNNVTITNALTVGGNTAVTGNLTTGGNATITGKLTGSGDVSFEKQTVRIKDLRGPYNVPLQINSHTQFLAGNNVTITDNLTVGGKAVICAGETVQITTSYFSGTRYLNGTGRETHKDHNGTSWPVTMWADGDSASKLQIKKA